MSVTLRLMPLNAFLKSLLLVFALSLGLSVVSAQEIDPGRRLLEAVEKQSVSRTSLSAKGSITVKLGSSETSLKTHVMPFEISWRPDKASFHLAGEFVLHTTYCNAESMETYYPGAADWIQVKPSSPAACLPDAMRPGLSELAASVRMGGTGREMFQGNPTGCTLLVMDHGTAPLSLMVAPGVTLPTIPQEHVLCVDPVRKIVLRDYFRGTVEVAEELRVPIQMTIWVGDFQADDEIPDHKLGRDIPTLLFRVEPEKTLLRTLLIGSARNTGGKANIAPDVIHRVDPDFTTDPTGKRIRGRVDVYIEIGLDGKPHQIRVLRSSDPRIVQNAIHAVGSWRFKPGSRDGKPVVVPAIVQIDFK